MNNKCGCGNADKLAGYQVCENCKEARELYPHIFEGVIPDKIEENGDLTHGSTNDTDPPYSDASIGLPARFGRHLAGEQE